MPLFYKNNFQFGFKVFIFILLAIAIRWQFNGIVVFVHSYA